MHKIKKDAAEKVGKTQSEAVGQRIHARARYGFQRGVFSVARMESVIPEADDKEIGKFNLQIKNLFKMSDVGLLSY
jgi:hypothetical protein